MKRTCLSLFAAVLLTGTAQAQMGRIGMTPEALEARVGKPYRIADEAEPLVWFYKSTEASRSFAYSFHNGQVASTTAMVTYTDAEEARTWAQQVVTEMEGKGWQTASLDTDHYTLEASRAVYHIDLLPESDDAVYVLLSHVHKDALEAVYTDRQRDLLAFHLAPEPAEEPAPPATAVEAPPEMTPAVPQPKPPTAKPDTTTVQTDTTAAVAYPTTTVQDTTTTVQDSTTTVQDSTTAVQDSTTAVQDSTTAVQAPPPTAPPPAPAAGIDAATGGFTWVVASTSDLQEAEAAMRRFRAQGLTSSILKAVIDNQAMYRVGVGQYATREALQAARPTLPPEVPQDAWPLRIEPDQLLSDNRP